MHLKKIKPKPETKPILQSLREGLEQLKKPAASLNSIGSGRDSKIDRTRNNSTSSSSKPSNNNNSGAGFGGGGGFLERINKLRQASRSRNPAKKSASFTFAVRPEIAMKAAQKYSSLEPSESGSQNQPIGGASSKQPVQRSISTSVLEVPAGSSSSSSSSSSSANVQLQPDYSRVRDSLAPSTPTPKPEPIVALKPVVNDEIYAEICENHVPVRPTPPPPRPPSPNKCPGSHVMARIKILVKEDQQYKPERDVIDGRKLDRKYVNSIFVTSSHSHHQDSIVNAEDEIIYNTVF